MFNTFQWSSGREPSSVAICNYECFVVTYSFLPHSTVLTTRLKYVDYLNYFWIYACLGVNRKGEENYIRTTRNYR